MRFVLRLTVLQQPHHADVTNLGVLIARHVDTPMDEAEPLLRLFAAPGFHLSRTRNSRFA